MVVDAANSARLRLMCLSAAAEKLQRQAALSVQTGRENDAREGATFLKEKGYASFGEVKVSDLIA